jgi:F-type H+-transporting ATPase subunit delta
MNESQISVRYAKALFQSASARKVLDRVYSDMEMITETCQVAEFQYLLAVPSLAASEKCRISDSVFRDALSELSLSMIHLVIENKREIYLPAIARNFRDLYRRAKGIRAATLVTAQPLEKREVDQIRKVIKGAFREEVMLTQSLDEEIIGGFVLTIEDMQYDASVSRSLRKMKNQLMQTQIEK